MAETVRGPSCSSCSDAQRRQFGDSSWCPVYRLRCRVSRRRPVAWRQRGQCWRMPAAMPVTVQRRRGPPRQRRVAAWRVATRRPPRASSPSASVLPAQRYLLARTRAQRLGCRRAAQRIRFPPERARAPLGGPQHQSGHPPVGARGVRRGLNLSALPGDAFDDGLALAAACSRPPTAELFDRSVRSASSSSSRGAAAAATPPAARTLPGRGDPGSTADGRRWRHRFVERRERLLGGNNPGG